MLGRTNTGGGGGVSAGLKIVGNPRPKNPTEDIVWVNTDVDITGYFLTAEQPENLVEGNLWIKISDSSNIKVGTPLGKDYITIMLDSVSQYIGGELVSVEAMSFQDGVWVDWIPKNRLFKSGYGAIVEFTLGKEQNAITPTITKDAFVFNENNNGAYNWAYAITKDPIDVTLLTKIYVTAKVTSSSKNLYFGTSSSNSSPTKVPSDGYTNMQIANIEKEYEFNVSTISGMRYFHIIGNNGATITDIRYE